MRIFINAAFAFAGLAPVAAQHLAGLRRAAGRAAPAQPSLRGKA